jgi:hypothetical protein
MYIRKSALAIARIQNRVVHWIAAHDSFLASSYLTLTWASHYMTRSPILARTTSRYVLSSSWA